MGREKQSKNSGRWIPRLHEKILVSYNLFSRSNEQTNPKRHISKQKHSRTRPSLSTFRQCLLSSQRRSSWGHQNKRQKKIFTILKLTKSLLQKQAASCISMRQNCKKKSSLLKVSKISPSENHAYF